jgi:hypothetical protein
MKNNIRKPIGDFFNQYDFRIAVGAVTVCSFLLMVWASAQTGLWNDEYATIADLHIGQSLGEFLKTDAGEAIGGFSIFAYIARFWYQIVPFGEVWLILLPELASCAAIVFIALTGRRLGGKTLGVISCIPAASSHFLLVYCAEEFRYYAFTLLFSSMAMYFFITRFITPESGGSGAGSAWHIQSSRMALLGISMGLMVNTQPLSLPVCLALFLGDVFLFAKKRIGAGFIIPYIIAALFLVPGYLIHKAIGTAGFPSLWNPPDFGLKYIIAQLAHMIDLSYIRLFILALGAFVILFGLAKTLRARRPFAQRDFFQPLLLFVPFLNVLILLTVSLTIDGYKIFLARYLSWTVPYFFVISSIGISWVIGKLRFAGRKAVTIAVCIVLFAGLFCIDLEKTIDYPGFDEGDKQSAAWLWEQNDVAAPDTLVIWCNWHPEEVRLYYFVKKGFHEDVDIIAFNNVDGLLERAPQKVYAVASHAGLSPDMAAFLSEHYQLTEHIPAASIDIYEKSEK